MILYFCGDMCCEWAEVDGTCGCKCEMWPIAWQGAVCCVQGKVECSAVVYVVSCSAVGSAVCVIPPYRTVFHTAGFWAVIETVYCCMTNEPSPHSVLLPQIVPRFNTSWSHTSTPTCIFLTECLIVFKFWSTFKLINADFSFVWSSCNVCFCNIHI